MTLASPELTGRDASPALLGGPGRSAIRHGPTADALAFVRRPRNSRAKPSAIRRGSCGRHHFARDGKAIQVGWDPSGSSGWRAEGDGARAVWRGPGNAGHAGRPRPAL